MFATKTLYLVQANYDRLPIVLQQLQLCLVPEDEIILFGEALLGLNRQDMQTIISHYHVYLLQDEAMIWGGQIPDNIQQISFDSLAKLVLNYTRCICVK